MPVPFLSHTLQKIGEHNAAVAQMQQQHLMNQQLAYQQFVNEHLVAQQLQEAHDKQQIEQMTPALTQYAGLLNEQGKTKEAQDVLAGLNALRTGGYKGFEAQEKLRPKPPQQQFAGLSETGEPLSYNPQTNTIGKIKMQEGQTTVLPKYTGGAKLEGPGLDYASIRYQLYGTLPTGIRNPAINTKIMMHAAELNQQAGVTQQDAATIQIKAQTLKAEMQKNQIMRATIKPFERSAGKVLGQIENLNKTLDRTGVPMVNAWINAGRRSITGNPELAAFDLYITTFKNDYARITTTVTGGGVTAQAARDEIGDKLNAAMNPEQLQAVIDAAKFDLKARVGTMDEYDLTLKQELQNIIPSKLLKKYTPTPMPTPTPALPEQPKATHKFNPETGKIELIK